MKTHAMGAFVIELAVVLLTASSANAQFSPSLKKQAADMSIPQGQTTTLMFSLKNNDPTFSLMNVMFSPADTLPAGLTATPVTLLPSTPSNGCGALTATITATTVQVSGSLGPAESCSFSFVVTGTAPGPQTNPAVTITGDDPLPGGGTAPVSGMSMPVTVSVQAPPSIMKAFSCNMGDP